MQLKIVKTFLNTSDFFYAEDLEKVKSLQSQSDTFHRQMRSIHPNIVEIHLENYISAYSAEPTDENLAKFLNCMHEVHRLSLTQGRAQAIVEGEHIAFLNREVLPWLLAVTARLQTDLGAHMDTLQTSEIARSVEMMGNEDGAAGVVAHCNRVRKVLASFPSRFRVMLANNPDVSLRSCVREIVSLGFDVQLTEACGVPEPIPETEFDRSVKRSKATSKLREEKESADAAEAARKQEVAAAAEKDRANAVVRTFAELNGLETAHIPGAASVEAGDKKSAPDELSAEQAKAAYEAAVALEEAASGGAGNK